MSKDKQKNAKMMQQLAAARGQRHMVVEEAVVADEAVGMEVANDEGIGDPPEPPPSNPEQMLEF